MKIVLRAFGNKLSGVMEVPEETSFRFKLALAQPIQFSKFDATRHSMMEMPLQTICEFEWTGGTFSQEGHDWHGAREYQLISVNKQ